MKNPHVDTGSCSLLTAPLVGNKKFRTSGVFLSQGKAIAKCHKDLLLLSVKNHSGTNSFLENWDENVMKGFFHLISSVCGRNRCLHLRSKYAPKGQPPPLLFVFSASPFSPPASPPATPHPADPPPQWAPVAWLRGLTKACGPSTVE